MPLFKGRSSLLEVQNRAVIKTAKERAQRIDELERKLQIAASQIGQLQRELQTARGRTGKLERDLQTAQERTGTGERDLQQGTNDVERLTFERDFYSKKAGARVVPCLCAALVRGVFLILSLRPCNPRHHWQRGGTRGQMQECAAGKFHLNLPLASHHSITSSARASRGGGTSRLSALAVFRLMTSSYLVGACTGRSAGFSPRRMRSTYPAARRYWSSGLGP